MSSKFSSAFVVTLLLSHAVLAPLTVIAQEQDASPQQVQKKNNSSLNESVSKNSSETSGDTSQDSVAQESNQTVTENIDMSEVPDENVDSELVSGDVSTSSEIANETTSKAVSGNWEYTDKGTYCVITAYSGTEKDWVVPNEINGKPTKITSDIIHNGNKNPESVTIQAGRFGKVGVEGSSLRGLFQQERTIKSIDLSGLDTSNVTDMGYMFQAASALTSVNLNGLNTSNVRQMDYMFSTNASGLTTLDLSSFDTSKVTTMSSMFADSTGLQTVNLSSFNTSSVIQMSYMFMRCSSLTNLDISNFDTSYVQEMRYMFEGCSKLTSLNLSNFNTSRVRMMNMMFENCSSLTSVDLSSFDTSNVQSMQRMFKNSPGLTKLDLRNFTSNSLTDTSEMFYMATTTPLTVIVTDATFLNYNYIADNRTIGQLLLNANGGTFNDGSVEKNYFTSCAIRPEETSLDKLEEFKQNNLPTKTGFLFKGYTTTTDTSQATSVLDLIGTVYDAQWKARTISLEVPTAISFGTHKLSRGTNYYSVDSVDGKQLSVTDDRGVGSKWQLTAKLQAPLTNNGKTLPNSLVYKTDAGEETITENVSQVIATHTTSTDSEKTTISDGWTNDQGLMLKLEEGKAAAGEYSTIIEWTLNDAP